MRGSAYAGLAGAVGIVMAMGASTGRAEPAPALGETFSAVDAYVYHCHDGDTCRVRIAGAVWLNVRLAGIDAPEVGGARRGEGQPLGAEARDFLNARVKGKAVTLRQVDLDQYNRPV